MNETNLQLAALITTIILCIIVAYNLISQFLGKSLFKISIEDIVKNQEKRQNFKKGIKDYYVELIHKIQKFKKKHKLFLVVNKYSLEDMEILLTRTNVTLTPDSPLIATYEEWSSRNTLWTLLSLALLGASFVIFSIFNLPILRILFMFIGVTGILYTNVFQTILLKSIVSMQNAELSSQFGDFYLKQHRILLKERKNPFTKGLTIYQVVTKNEFMRNWCKLTLQLIKQTSESQVVTQYQKLYRDIPSIAKLLRLEEQAVIDGSRIEPELKGLREQVMQQKKIDIDIHAEKLVKIANILIMLVFIVTFQAAFGIVVYVMLYGGINF